MFARKKTDHVADRIESFDIAAGPEWAALSLADPAVLGGQRLLRPLEEVADELTTDADGAARLRAELDLAFPRMIEAQPHAQMLAVWVPDPVAGLTQAVLTVELLLGEGATLDDIESSIVDRTAAPGREVLTVATARLQLPAGPALVTDLTSGAAREPIEFQRIIWVAPEASGDLVSLAVATTALHLVDDVQDEAEQIAASLVLVLGPVTTR